jgi:hypothetical protein
MSIEYNTILQRHIDTDKHDPDEVKQMEEDHEEYRAKLETKFKFTK